jgi:C_GCAxxG_C_C family probable redox protein
MLSVGKYKLEDLDERSVKMTTGFAGGVGDTRQELCGAFSAGVMIIGALYGRTAIGADHSACIQKTRAYRQRFQEVMGSISCFELRAERYGSEGIEPCSVLVERAARELLKVT